MALDRSGISVEGRTLLSSLKSRDFNITVRVLLTEPKLSVSEIIQMTASKALDGTHCILPSRASLGTEVNVIADGFSSIPEGLNDYPSGHTVLLLVTPDGGSEVCLMGASCDETIVADSRLHLLINLEETDGIFNPSVDFDSYVPQGIINDMFSSMKDSLDQYVTVGTKQTVTGQKVFTGTINVSSPSDADNVYLQLQTGGDKKQSPVSSLYFWDTHRNVLGGVGFESSGNGTNQFLTSYVRRYANNYNAFVSGVVDQKVVSNHYNVLVDDSCVFFESPSSSEPLVGAWHEAARALSDYYAESTDTGRKQAATYSKTDDYRERIRLRKVLYQEQITDTPKGTVKTYVDLYAQNITNVADTVKFQYTETETYTLRLWNDQAGDVVDTPVTGPVPHDLLTISKDGGVYSTHFRGGYEIDNTSYSFGSAGSLTFETSVPVNADNAHLPTSSAVKDYVDSSVSSSMATVNNATLTIQKNGTTVQTFTANSATDKTANITVPTAMADLSDSSSYVLQRGQEFVEGVYDETEGFWVQSSQDSLYNGMCLNIYVPVRVCSGNITVKTSTGNYRHNIYYRGYGSTHAPVIHAGSMLSITFHNTDSNHIGWYADTYDIAHWKQCPEDFTKNFVGRLLPTDSTFTHDLNVSYGVFSGLNFLMMDTEGNWYPFLARNAAESSAPLISGKSFNVSQIVWDASSGHSDHGSGVFFSSHPKASIKHLMPYISWTMPCDLCRQDSEQNLYSDFDLYMRSCDHPSRESDVRTLVTNILQGHVDSGGEISGSLDTCVNSIMTSVSQKRFPIFICSNYRQGAWEAIRDGMYTFKTCNGHIEGVESEDKFAEFVQYKAGAPVWLNLNRNSDGGLYPYNLSFCPCFYSYHDSPDNTDACVLVGFMNGVDNLNFIQNHPVYYNTGSNVEWDLRPYDVKEKLVDADIQGSFVGNISLPYGTCSTAKSTDAKIVNSLSGFNRSPIGFQKGDLIFVKFSDGNTSSSPTLNIKGTGAVAVRTSPSTYLGNVPEGDTLLLRYDTENNLNNPSDSQSKTWYVVNSSGSSNLYTARAVDGVSFDGSANITHYCTCQTASGTGDKTVTVIGFVLEIGARVTVKFLDSNTALNPTLNVDNGSGYTGAKAIMYRGTSSVSDISNYYRWQSGDIIDFIYDGINWVMVGWQTYAYYAESATSASNATSASHATSATYATNLRYSSTNVLTATDSSTVTSVATIRPKTSGTESLGTSGYRWNGIYANYGSFSTSLATDGTLEVTGASTLSGGLSLSNGASLSGDIVINNTLYFGSDKTVKMNLYKSGIDVTGHLTPVSGNTYNLGSDLYPWDRLYVNYITGTGVAKSIAGYGTETSQVSTYPIGSLILAKLTTTTNSSGTSLSNNTWYNSTEIGDVSASKLKPVAFYSSDGGTTTGKTYTSPLSYGTWRILGRVFSSNMSSYCPTVLVVRIA